MKKMLDWTWKAVLVIVLVGCLYALAGEILVASGLWTSF